MRVICKCGHKGRIGHSEALSPDFRKLYCQCLDVHCGHSWVAHLTFSHTLSPSAKSVDSLLFDRLRELPKAQQRLLFDQLGALPAS
ncbi:ogr/Delta-like zinc finger family protein [Pseudomonas sp. MAFF 302046]|uniref:Ogr/Delta-like zinc finger family protein n=1 Tax=Pseudomonas morbosilactucae TaxID=2938197 RepID=A0ABT0JR18_9PSED|nr:ogr/Delta-like zinc finger family protein [Pseudomonas morbosilactucae]MCK9818271.1 ogr/Delta-like zinc finger family protein [Pseudomonas morbosilactucae]